jgi:hypothetical protein
MGSVEGYKSILTIFFLFHTGGSILAAAVGKREKFLNQRK